MTKLLHAHRTGNTYSRSIVLSGKTILSRLKDRKFSVKTTFDGKNIFPRVMNNFTNVVERSETYRVSVIFDAGEHETEHRFIYTIKERL